MDWLEFPISISDPKFLGLLAGIIILLGFGLVVLTRKRVIRDEETVDAILQDLGPEYTIYRDVVLPAQGGMSHIDFVAVSPYGIWVIDVRPEAGAVSGDVNAREWTVGKRETIYNPVWRNRTHRNGLENLIGKMPMNSLVVFINAKLKSDFGSNVLEFGKMRAFIQRDRTKRLSEEQLNFIGKTLRVSERKTGST